MESCEARTVNNVGVRTRGEQKVRGARKCLEGAVDRSDSNRAKIGSVLDEQPKAFNHIVLSTAPSPTVTPRNSTE